MDPSENTTDPEAGPSFQSNHKYMIKEETILGYNNYLNRIRAIEQIAEKEGEQIVVLFTGTGNPGGCWCSDCNYLEDILNGFKNKPNGLHGYFVRVMVGYENEWKNESCHYRLDTKIHLKLIPTIMLWNSNKRLSGIQVFEADRLLDLFTPDIDEK